MNLPELLQEYNIDFRSAGESPHVSNGWVGVVCPWCGAGTGKYGLGIHLGSLAASCWKCGPHSIVETLKELTGESWDVCRNLVGDMGRLDLPQGPHRGRYVPPEGAGPLLAVHESYLRGRGFDPGEIVQLWGVGGIGLDPRLAWRLFIPARGLGGNLVSWTTRGCFDGVAGSGVPRYISARPEEESAPLKSLLYGAEHARHAVAVVEGPFDVFRIGPGAVATFGVQYTKAQVEKIARFPLRVIAFDNEAGAQRQAAKLAEELSALPGRTVRVELEAPDPGSASAREVELLRKSFLD